jgi:hypothetical protein
MIEISVFVFSDVSNDEMCTVLKQINGIHAGAFATLPLIVCGVMFVNLNPIAWAAHCRPL